jgi:hypothetical protein
MKVFNRRETEPAPDLMTHRLGYRLTLLSEYQQREKSFIDQGDWQMYEHTLPLDGSNEQPDSGL